MTLARVYKNFLKIRFVSKQFYIENQGPLEIYASYIGASTIDESNARAEKDRFSPRLSIRR